MSAGNGGVGFGGAPPDLPGISTGSVSGLAAVPLQTQCAVALQHLHGWLQVAVAQQPQLATVVPPLVHAVQLYRSGQYEACATQLEPLIAHLRQARAQRQTLPPL